jgi:hypothetical protein
MPMPPTDMYWIEQIREIATNQPRLGPALVRQLLEQRVGEEGCRDSKGDWTIRRVNVRALPSERTISREIKKFRALIAEKPEVQTAYREFHWPVSMGGEDLPWEASAALLDLLCYLNESPHDNGRPLISVARWFWRVTQARPTVAVSSRLFIAKMLALADAAGVDHTPGIEWMTAYHAADSFPAVWFGDATVADAGELIPEIPPNVTLDQATEIAAILLGARAASLEPRALADELRRMGDAIAKKRKRMEKQAATKGAKP